MGKILIIDDDEAFLNFLDQYIREYFPLLRVETCTDPVKALSAIRMKDLDLLLVDLEMPKLDGTKVYKFATDSGVDKNRIVILSGHEADYLHEKFPMGTCLAVLNKYEARQKSVLDMIFNSLQAKQSRMNGNPESL
jgi:CheY-like chemotaxis protein